MPSVDSLRKRVATMRARANQDRLPRTWAFVLEVDEQLPADVEANINAEMRKNDHVYIRYAPQGYLGTAGREGDWSWGYVYWHGGSAIIKQDGTLEKVKR